MAIKDWGGCLQIYQDKSQDKYTSVCTCNGQTISIQRKCVWVGISVTVCVRLHAFIHLWDKRKKEKENDEGKVETSVARAPGQKTKVQSAKMTALEYESRALGTLGT